MRKRRSRITKFTRTRRQQTHRNTRNGIQTLVHPHDGRFRLIDGPYKSPGMSMRAGRGLDWCAADARVELRVPGCGPAGDRNLLLPPHLPSLFWWRVVRWLWCCIACAWYGQMFGRESKQVVVVFLSLVATDSVESLLRDVSNDFCRPHLPACWAQV
jgi:hypothetical protein